MSKRRTASQRSYPRLDPSLSWPPQLLWALLASWPYSSPSPPPPGPLSCRELKSTARDVLGQHLQGQLTHFGLLQVEPDAHTSPAHPPPPSALETESERPGKGDSVAPLLSQKEVPLKQGRKQACSGQNDALTCASNRTWKECALS